MQSNRLLAPLRRKDRQQFLASCEQVELRLDEILLEPGQHIRRVYFPLDSFISQLAPVDAHENLELALIGNEGMLGISLVLGVNSAMLQAVVQGPGSALRMGAAAFVRELEKMPALRRRLKLYIYVLQVQLALTGTCNRFHTLDKRLAHWLLMSHDRAQLGNFHLTHKFLAQMLGVRRVGITNAAGLLQRRQVISYERGDIKVLSRTGLEKAACGCYESSKATYASILGK